MPQTIIDSSGVFLSVVYDQNGLDDTKMMYSNALTTTRVILEVASRGPLSS